MAFIECNHSSGLCLGYLLCTKIVEETWKHMIAFSNLYHRLCYRNLTSSIGNDNDPFVPHIQSHECYRSSRVSWQGISPRTADLVVPEYSGPSTRTVKIKTKCIKTYCNENKSGMSIFDITYMYHIVLIAHSASQEISTRLDFVLLCCGCIISSRSTYC